MSDIREIVLSTIENFQQMGEDFDINQIDHDLPLTETGVLDSIAFVNLVLELESRTNASVSLADIDPFEHTSVNGLVAFFS